MLGSSWLTCWMGNHPGPLSFLVSCAALSIKSWAVCVLDKHPTITELHPSFESLLLKL